MVESTWPEFTATMTPDDLELVEAFRGMALTLPGTMERVHRTEVQFRLDRVFAVAFIKSHRLEIAIDLLREVGHPLLFAAFPTTKKVVTHRLTITDPSQLDDSIGQLLAEAHSTVGPGTR